MGVRSVFRSKAPSGRVPESRRALYGDIEDVGPPIRVSTVPHIPAVDDAWEVDLHGIEGHFVNLWINEFQLDRAAVHATGGVWSRLGRQFAVDDVKLHVEAGTLQIGGRPLANQWSGSAKIDIADHDPRSLSGKDMVVKISGSTDLRAQVVDLAPVRALSGSSFGLRHGEGDLSVAVQLTSGVVEPTSRVQYSTPRLEVTIDDWVVRTEVDATATGTPEGPLGCKVGVDLGWGEVARSDHPDIPPARFERLSGFVSSHQRNLSQSHQLDDGRVDVTQFVVPDVRLLAGLSQKFQPRSGSLVGSLEVEVNDDGELVHQISGQLKSVKLKIAETSVAGAVQLEIAAESSKRLNRGHSTELEIDIRALAIDSHKGRSENGWIELHGDSKLAWEPDGTIKATLRGRMDDLEMVLAHADERRRLVEKMPDLDIAQPLNFVVDVLRSARGMTDIEVRKLDRPTLHIEGLMRSRGNASRSAFRLDRVKIGLTRHAGGREIHLGTDEAWMSRQTDWVRSFGSGKSSPGKGQSGKRPSGKGPKRAGP